MHYFSDVLKYFGYELGAQTNFDKATGTCIVNGAHDAKKVGVYSDIILHTCTHMHTPDTCTHTKSRVQKTSCQRRAQFCQPSRFEKLCIGFASLPCHACT